MSTSHEPTDVDWGHAMLRGVGLGWLIMPLVTLIIVQLAAPSSSWAMRIGIAAVVGLWVGLFFGGVSSVAVFMMGYERRAAAERLARRQALVPAQERSEETDERPEETDERMAGTDKRSGETTSKAGETAALREGRPTSVATPPASGKTVAA